MNINKYVEYDKIKIILSRISYIIEQTMSTNSDKFQQQNAELGIDGNDSQLQNKINDFWINKVDNVNEIFEISCAKNENGNDNNDNNENEYGNMDSYDQLFQFQQFVLKEHYHF